MLAGTLKPAMIGLCAVGLVHFSPMAHSQQRETREFLGAVKDVFEFLKEHGESDRPAEPQPSEIEAPREDVAYILSALSEAMMIGRPAGWQNPRNGHYGEVIPLTRLGSSSDQICQDYERTLVVVSGRDATTYRGTACRQAGHRWVITTEHRVSPTGVARIPGRSEGAEIRPKSQADKKTVTEVQRLLTDLGYDPGPIDGILGRKTTAAIQAFQADQDLTADGLLSPELIATLRAARETSAGEQGIAGAGPETRSAPAEREAEVFAEEAVPQEEARSPLKAEAVRSATQPTPQRSPDEVHACDLLAAADRDRHAVSEGVAIEDIDGPLALDACRRARAEFPGVSRFAYQEARALYKLERYAEARTILEQLADADYPLAQSLLGLMQEQGFGFPSKDLREAVAWYRRAADLGEPWAQMKLGWALAEGKGGLRRNDEEALRWFRTAAEAGEAYAAAYVGYFHEAGRGVPVDTAVALEWYRQAADAGNEWALEQVERFDASGAREIREALRQREEAKRAEIAARKREAEALPAAKAQELPQIAEVQPPILSLGEAIEDLSWTLAEKVDADVLAVARALREAHETAGTEAVFEPLAAATAEDAASSAEHDSAPGVASVWWRLAVASAGQGGPRQAPVDTAQARLMVEVANRYESPTDQEMALRLYLLGFRDLDSPIALPAWVADGPLPGAHAAAQHLRERLETLREELREEQLSAEVELDPLLERLQALREEIVASRSGVVEIAAIGDPPWDRSLGAIGGLAKLRGQLASHSTTEGTVSLESDLDVTPGDGFQIARLSVAGRVEDGTELAPAEQQFPIPIGASLPDLSGVSQVDAQALRRELAEAMLVALPTEFANLWWVTEDMIEEVRKALGQPEPNPWSPHFKAASAATGSVAAADTEPGTVVARSEARAKAVQPAAAPAQASRMAKVELRDGSLVTAPLVSGKLTFKSALGESLIPVDNLAALAEGQLRLHDGTLLRGELVGGEIVIATGSGDQALAASDIVSIAFVEEGSTTR